MKSKMEYMILTEETPVKLVENVTKLIRVGWKPQGGVAAVKKAGIAHAEYLQAVVKE